MKDKYPDYWHYLIGDFPLGAIYAFITWALVAAAISLLVNVVNRDVASAATPVKTSWRFMLLDNLRRIIANLLAIPVFIRIALILIPIQWMVPISIVIGILIDRLALRLKTLGILAGDTYTAKLKEKLQLDDHTVIPKSNP